VTAPGRARDQAEHERRHEREEAVEEHGRHDARVRAAETGQNGDQAQLDDADPARRDRQGLRQANDREGREGFDQIDLSAADTEHAQAGQQD
jgi:hypothetical protein